MDYMLESCSNKIKSDVFDSFHKACRVGDLDAVKKWIRSGANLESADNCGDTPLIIAIMRSFDKITDILLHIGASPKTANAEGKTALHYASLLGRKDLVEKLLEAGAKNVSDKDGKTPLLCAALSGDRKIVDLLSVHCLSVESSDMLKLCAATLIDRGDVSTKCITLLEHAVNRVWSSQDSAKGKVYRIYGNMYEVKTAEDVEYVSESMEALHMQALIIRERILGEANSITQHYIFERGRKYYQFGAESWFRFCMHALSLQQKYTKPLDGDAMLTALSLAKILCHRIVRVARGLDSSNEELEYPEFSESPDGEQELILFNFIITELERFGGVEFEDDYRMSGNYPLNFLLNLGVEVGCKMIFLMNQMGLFDDFPKVVRDDGNILAKSLEWFVTVTKVLKLCPLHYLINTQFSLHFRLEKIISAWISAGGDINAKDAHGNTVLHVALRSSRSTNDFICFLLENGAQILGQNDDNETCFQIMQLCNRFRSIKTFKYITLMGFAANVLQRNAYPGLEERLIADEIKNFVRIH